MIVVSEETRALLPDGTSLEHRLAEASPAVADVPMLDPPVDDTRPLGESRAMRFTAGEPPPANGKARPPRPPRPPADDTSRPLAARPVLPERATALEPAPLLADESALPAASAPPVAPEAPVAPVVTAPPTAVALPRMAELVAVGVELATPVPPVAPELPDAATGWAAAVDAAAPVSPVLVLPDWA